MLDLIRDLRALGAAEIELKDGQITRVVFGAPAPARPAQAHAERVPPHDPDAARMQRYRAILGVGE